MSQFTDRIRPAVQAALDAADYEESRGRFATAFGHLERAHVLGQQSTREHVRVHWRMLRFAIRNRLAPEAAGQSWRVLAAAVFTPLGLVPRGNTGGAGISGVARLDIPQDLQRVIDAARRAA
jgi:hypothetical protein